MKIIKVARHAIISYLLKIIDYNLKMQKKTYTYSVPKKGGLTLINFSSKNGRILWISG